MCHYASSQWPSREEKMFTAKKAVLLLSVALTLSVIGWTLAGALAKHDPWILGKLSEEFADDNRFEHVQFTVGSGFVSLKGSVALLEDKRQAVRKANQVDHVRSVTNNITVIPPRIPDFALRIQLKHDLRKQGFYGLKLEVCRGVVTVHGTEPSNRERILTQIANTEGVRAIRERATRIE